MENTSFLASCGNCHFEVPLISPSPQCYQLLILFPLLLTRKQNNNHHNKSLLWTTHHPHCLLWLALFESLNTSPHRHRSLLLHYHRVAGELTRGLGYARQGLQRKAAPAASVTSITSSQAQKDKCFTRAHLRKLKSN